MKNSRFIAKILVIVISASMVITTVLWSVHVLG